MYASKLDNLNEKGNFLERKKLLKLNQEIEITIDQQSNKLIKTNKVTKQIKRLN